MPTTITSRLEVLNVLAHASELSVFGCKQSTLQELVDYLKAAFSSQHCRHSLLMEHNLLHRLAEALAKALQLIGRGTGLDHVTSDTLESIWLLGNQTCHWIAHTQKEAAGMAAAVMAAVCGEW